MIIPQNAILSLVTLVSNRQRVSVFKDYFPFFESLLILNLIKAREELVKKQ